MEPSGLGVVRRHGVTVTDLYWSLFWRAGDSWPWNRILRLKAEEIYLAERRDFATGNILSPM